MHPLIKLKTTPPLLITLTLLCFGLLPSMQAVSPPPDGGYPGGNTAEGQNALFSLTTGGYNTAVGFLSLRLDSTSSFNTAIGAGALLNNTTGGGNIALGAVAGLNLTTGDNNIDIGNQGVVGEANTIRIGTEGTQTATYIAGIVGHGEVGCNVWIDCFTGRLGVQVSSARFKDEIKPMDNASEALFSLKPVTFRYKQDIDPEANSQLGLVAEDVEKVNPDLVVRDKDGKPYSVRYDQVNAMLLNEFLKEHRKVEEQDCKLQEQGATIARLTSTDAKQEATIAKQQRQIEALTAVVQKVSAHLEVTKPALQTVQKNR